MLHESNKQPSSGAELSEMKECLKIINLFNAIRTGRHPRLKLNNGRIIRTHSDASSAASNETVSGDSVLVAMKANGGNDASEQGSTKPTAVPLSTAQNSVDNVQDKRDLLDTNRTVRSRKRDWFSADDHSQNQQAQGQLQTHNRQQASKLQQQQGQQNPQNRPQQRHLRPSAPVNNPAENVYSSQYHGHALWTDGLPNRDFRGSEMHYTSDQFGPPPHYPPPVWQAAAGSWTLPYRSNHWQNDFPNFHEPNGFAPIPQDFPIFHHQQHPGPHHGAYPLSGFPPVPWHPPAPLSAFPPPPAVPIIPHDNLVAPHSQTRHEKFDEKRRNPGLTRKQSITCDIAHNIDNQPARHDPARHDPAQKAGNQSMGNNTTSKAEKQSIRIDSAQKAENQSMKSDTAQKDDTKSESNPVKDANSATDLKSYQGPNDGRVVKNTKKKNKYESSEGKDTAPTQKRQRQASIDAKSTESKAQVDSQASKKPCKVTSSDKTDFEPPNRSAAAESTKKCATNEAPYEPEKFIIPGLDATQISSSEASMVQSVKTDESSQRTQDTYSKSVVQSASAFFDEKVDEYSPFHPQISPEFLQATEATRRSSRPRRSASSRPASSDEKRASLEDKQLTTTIQNTEKRKDKADSRQSAKMKINSGQMKADILQPPQTKTERQSFQRSTDIEQSPRTDQLALLSERTTRDSRWFNENADELLALISSGDEQSSQQSAAYTELAVRLRERQLLTELEDLRNGRLSSTAVEYIVRLRLLAAQSRADPVRTGDNTSMSPVRINEVLTPISRSSQSASSSPNAKTGELLRKLVEKPRESNKMQQDKQVTTG